MVRRKELPAVFMPWTVPQVHLVLADSEYLAKFHKDSYGSSSLELEPWDPPGAAPGFVRKRRCLFTAPLQGPSWFKTMLGSPELVDMMEVHEMMYDPESGCIMVQADSYMLLDGGAATMRMRHMQWLYRPVMAEDLTGCEVKTTLTACGASFRNAQLQDLPQQVEHALASIATEEATKFNDFTLCYMGALQEAGQLPTPEHALHALRDSGSGRPSSGAPITPGKLVDMPFNLVSGALVYQDAIGPQHMTLSAAQYGADTTSTENSMQTTPLYKPGAASVKQGDMWSAPGVHPKTGGRLSMTDSVLEGIPAAGKEVDSLLGTRLNSLDLATQGRSLRIKTWRSHAHDSGMSLRPLYDQRSSDDSQQTQSTAAKRPSTESGPTRSSRSSIDVEERALLERLTREHNGKQAGKQQVQLSPKERRMVDEILEDSMEADELAAEVEAEAGRGMQYSSIYYEDEQRRSAEMQPAAGDWVHAEGRGRAFRGSHDSLHSSSEYSVSSVGTVSTCAPLSPSAIKVCLTPRGGRSLEIMRKVEADHGSVLRSTTPRSQGSVRGTGAQGVRAAHGAWHEQDDTISGKGMQHQAGTGVGFRAVSPIHWTAVSAGLEDGAVSVQPHRFGAFSPKSTFSWQPLSDVGRPDEEELFPENLMLTEQSDLGLLRNRLAQVLPKENLTRRQDPMQSADQHDRDSEGPAIRCTPEQQTLQQPHSFASAMKHSAAATEGAWLGGADDQEVEAMDTSLSSEHSFKLHDNGAKHMASTTIVETLFWDAEEEFAGEGPVLSAELLKSLDDVEKHDMHIPEAGVLHTSSSIPTESPDTAAAIATVMSVAIETVNAVAETAMNTVNRITRISLEQLQSINGLTSHSSIPAPFSCAHQGHWDDSLSLSRQCSLTTSADACSFRAPGSVQLAAYHPRPLLQQDFFPGKGAYPEDVSAAVPPISLAAEAQHRNFSIEGELQNFRQAGLGRKGADSAPIFRRGFLGPPGGPLNFKANIAHPNAALSAADARRALVPPVQREQGPFKGVALADVHDSAPPFARRAKVKVPPLWTGSSPFEGRVDDTMTSEALSEAQGGMQWVHGKGWVEAEKTFLQSFHLDPPLLARSGSRPRTAPQVVSAGVRPSPVQEHRVHIKAAPVQVTESAEPDDDSVVQRASREHPLAERRRRAAQLAARGAPLGATDSLPPPRELPSRHLPTAATRAEAASRRRTSKGGLCGKLAGFLYACRPAKTTRTVSYTERNRPPVSQPPS